MVASAVLRDVEEARVLAAVTRLLTGMMASSGPRRIPAASVAAAADAVRFARDRASCLHPDAARKALEAFSAARAPAGGDDGRGVAPAAAAAAAAQDEEGAARAGGDSAGTRRREAVAFLVRDAVAHPPGRGREHAGTGARLDPRLGEADFWRALAPAMGVEGLRGDGASTSAPGGPQGRAGEDTGPGGAQGQSRRAASAAERLSREGYFVDQADSEGDTAYASMVASLATLLDTLHAAGFPPVFAYMFDEAWHVLERAAGLGARALLLAGGEGEPAGGGSSPGVVLEPTLFAFRLTRQQAAVERGAKAGAAEVGNNFGLPHRDYSYAASHFPGTRAPKLLSLWVPLSSTLDPDCGRLHVVPLGADPMFTRDGHAAHMRCAVPGAEPGSVELRFPLAAGRPLALPAGATAGWRGSLIHWGGTCSPHLRPTSSPRMSFAFTVRRADAEPYVDGMPAGAVPAVPLDLDAPRGALARAVPLDLRLRLVMQGLVLFSRWFPLGDALPATALVGPPDLPLTL